MYDNVYGVYNFGMIMLELNYCCNHCNLSKDIIVINNGLFCNNDTAYKINLKSK